MASNASGQAGGGRILVRMLQEPGHLNPSFKLARALRSRGHDVRYLCIPDFEEYVAKQGFETVDWFPDLFPKGLTALQDRLGLVERRRGITARFNELVRRLVEDPAALDPVREFGPELMLVDVDEPAAHFAARRLGVPTLAINTGLPQTKDRGVPPIRSGGVYRPGPLGLLQSEAAWAAFLARRRVSAWLARPFGMGPPYDLTRRAAPHFDVQSAQLDCATAYMPRFRGTPELVLCPEAFDFPRPAMSERHFVESLDIEREELPFEWEGLDADKPLVYCSMGSQRYRPTQVRRLIHSLTQALVQRPNWQALLSLGRQLSPQELEPLPPNVVAVQRAPQLAVLQRAAVMVTHGGLGSIKECIVHGVPMLVYPLAVDQPGNAARVVYHGIGRRGDVKKVGVDGILGHLDQLLTDSSYRSRVQAMSRQFDMVEQQARGVSVVERLLLVHSTP